MKTIYIFIAGIILNCASAFNLSAQTNPAAQSLPYTQVFSSFNGSSTTYPAGWQGWTITGSLSTSYPTAAPAGDQALAGGSAASTSAGVYDMNSKIGLYSTGSALRSAVLSINTTSNTNIQVAYDAMTIRTENTRLNGLGLQYRVGTSGTFTNVSGSEYRNVLTPINTTGTTPVNTQRINVTLPSACDNQSVVQLRWVIRDSTGSGNRPSFAIDSVVITGTTSGPVILPDVTSISSFSAVYPNGGNATPAKQFIRFETQNLTNNLTITPPVGFQLAEDTLFSTTYTNSSPLILSTVNITDTVWVRFSASAVGNYSGNITFTSPGATNKNVSIPTSAVATKALTVSGATVTTKVYDGNTNATITGSLVGVEPGDVVTLVGTGTFNNPNTGSGKPVISTSTLSGAQASNYSLTQPTGLTGTIISGQCPTLSDTILWRFGSVTPDYEPLSQLTVSDISRGNNNGSTNLLESTSASTGYSGASGGNNAAAAAAGGALNLSTSVYFEFTLTPLNGGTVSLTGIRFGTRSTSTGPSAYALRSSIDNYASNIATGTIPTNSTWVLQNPTVTSVTSNPGTPVTFRLYGHSGTGNTVNVWRIDDLRLDVTFTQSPSLSSALYDTVCSGSPFNYTPASAAPSPVFSWTRPAVTGISNPAVTTPQSGSISESLTNTTNASVNVQYIYKIEGPNCFDTDTLTVTVLPSSINTTTVSACSTYFWSVNSQTYTASTIDTVINGCNLEILNLTITAPPTWYLDADSDGWYVNTQTSCTSPGSGWTNVLPDGGNGDCNDNNAAINPGLTEVCNNSIDDNCDGNVDENCITCTGAPATPGAISGPINNICINSTQSYSVAPVSGATGYFWTTTGDITIASGQGTNSASFNFGPNFGTGSIRVRAYNACDSSSVRLLSVKSTTLPTPGAIQGPASAVCANTTQTYTIPPVSGATAYEWSVAAGNVTLVGNPVGTTASFNFQSNFVTGTIRVRALNSCGASGYRTLGISSVPPTPGTINGPVTAVCAGSTSVAYSILPVANATGYTWSTTGNISISGGQNTTSATFDFASNFTSGTVRVQATNACGASAIRSIAVGSVPAIPGLISGQFAGVAPNSSGNYSIVTVPGAASYQWEVTGDAGIGSGQGTTVVSVNFGNTYSGGNIRVRTQNVCGVSGWRSANITGITPRLSAPIQKINIFPNPTTDKVIIQADGIESIMLYDLSGKVLQAQKYQSEYLVELGLNYPSGIYFIEICGEGWREVRKLVVE